MQEILKSDAKFRYLMLDRMRSDCEYYLGNGNRYAKYLWAGDEVNHIANMKVLWNSFPDGDKPEWLPYEKILEYEKEMCPKAILVERDYKGEHERFALTPDEFEKEFGTVVKNIGPVEGLSWNAVSLQPMVFISYSTLDVRVGDINWERFFTDMEWGLPESDIDAGNIAYIREDFMQSLKKYMPEKAPPLDVQIAKAEGMKQVAEPFSGDRVTEMERE